MITIKKDNVEKRSWKKKQDKKKQEFNIYSEMVRRALRLKNRDERIANASKSRFVPTKKNRKQFDVPENFSIVNNAKEVVTFFNRIEEYILDKKHKTHVFLNMRDVKHITVDALLYLLAIIKNIKSDGNIYSFGGNVPNDYKAKQIVQTSGFLSLMQHKNIETIVNNETITIRTGNQDDAVLVGEICDFIVKNSNLTLKHTRFLYTILGEMMSNSNEHAYTDDKVKAQKWIVYVEKVNGKFRFMFLDTGAGVIKTVSKKWLEKFNSADSDILYSTFKGEFRTQTKLGYRGKGLPKILKTVRDSMITEMDVISNKALVRLKKDYNEDELQDLNCNLDGTLYYWEIQTEDIS